MKRVKANYLNVNINDIENVHFVLDDQIKHPLHFQPWESETGYRPSVSFSIAHSIHSIVLKFYVSEKEIRACVTKTNDAVSQDSCVEFFIAIDETGYYNFEFNPIGTVLAAFGKNRSERSFIPEAILNKINTYTKFVKIHNRFSWEFLVILPFDGFIHHKMESLSGLICKGNFYKCGDALLQPHYLTWSTIESVKPDFHLPQFFGEIMFM